ncbi:MAG TPA: cytochrome c peroxidase [Blastocatellia bacterium]|nr:cytochrome c peroxidase [Blastocatellia bacterium]
MNRTKLFVTAIAICTFSYFLLTANSSAANEALDQELETTLARHGFTGRIESTVEARLGRPINEGLAGLGRLLFYDAIIGLKKDNACAGCHAPTTGYADTQSIAIGIDSNGLVGPNRAGPRNRRRSPTNLNAAFFPNMMWNSRFASLSGDPFDNRAGFRLPEPEGMTLSHLPHLLAAQAYMPPSDRAEMAGFDFQGDSFAIRDEIARRLNKIKKYRTKFGKFFPEVKAGAPITFEMASLALAEFQLTLAYADAPIDKFARGDRKAMTDGEKRGALLFFGKARCIECHAVSGQSNEMFSDFAPHVAGVPQLAPERTNATFDGPGADEDYGLEQITHDPEDRYKFRTSPLRNVGVQPTFFHNGAFTTIKDAIRHHLDVFDSARGYDPRAAGVDKDLNRLGPIEPVLERIDPILATPIDLTKEELQDLVQFVRDGLLDDRARPENLMKLKPPRVPSGLKPFGFE